MGDLVEDFVRHVGEGSDAIPNTPAKSRRVKEGKELRKILKYASL